MGIGDSPYLGSLPGHGVENVRGPLINTMNLADLLPTSTIWTGSNAAPCPMYPPLAPALMHCVTHGATPFRLNLHVRDLGHTSVSYTHLDVYKRQRPPCACDPTGYWSAKCVAPKRWTC